MTVHTRDISSAQGQLPEQIVNLTSNTPMTGRSELPNSLSDIEQLLGFEVSECRFLFKFPAILIGEEANGAAAILCRDKDGMRLVFLVLNQEGTEINVFEEADVSQQLANFTWSFANILSVMPTCESLTSQ